MTLVIVPVTLHLHTTVSGEGQKCRYVVTAGKFNLLVNKLIGSSLRKGTTKEQNIILFMQLTWEEHGCLFLGLNMPSGVAFWHFAITLP